jgi:hypothetical protein
MTFDFKRHLIKVQGGRSYLPVSARIVWFRQEHPDWGIHTEPIEINHEKQYAVFRAIIYNAEGKLMSMGTKKEDVKGFGDYMEKAETGAVGRALALCGFGTQFAPELDEATGGRFADSPQPMGGGSRYGGGNGGGENFGSRSNNGGDSYNSAPPRESYSSAPPPQRDRPAPIRETPPPVVRPEAARPAPLAHNGEDDFEALVSGGLRNATEDDPFGDEEEAVAPPMRPAPAVKTGVSPVSGPAGTPACLGCGKALTKAQQELSVRNYGEALCPVCQKDKSRLPAMAER